MYIGGALVLIAIGAVLRWAVTLHTNGFDIQLAGLIIFIVGIVGLVASVIFWILTRGPRPPYDDHHDHDYVHDHHEVDHI